MKAWNEAGQHMLTSPSLDYRWTRLCFCGQPVANGHVASTAVFGVPQITGSEEGRGPLYDVNGHQQYEGQRNPADLGGDQGHKLLETADTSGDFPKGAPLMSIRVGDRLIVSLPGEATEEVGRRTRAAVLSATRGAGIAAVIVSGLANEYISYFTTPEEYDRQHYEGGSTLYGPLSSVFLQGGLVDLSTRLVDGRAAPEPFPYDPTHGVTPDFTPYPQGPDAGRALSDPGDVRRLEQARFSWQGGPRGFDRPLDKPFVVLQVQSDRRWVPVATDLGLQVLWTVDDRGVYHAAWEVPLDAPRGTYRFYVDANRYDVISKAFRVSAIVDLSLRATTGRGGRPGVFVTYPGNHGLEVDTPPPDPGALQGDGSQLTWHPTEVDGGRVSFRVGRRRVVVRRKSGPGFSVRARRGQAVAVPAFGAHDAYGNTNSEPLRLR
jgi:hypothetical protein